MITYETFKRFDERLDRLLEICEAVREEVEKMSVEMDTLVTEVTSLRTVNDSILALVENLASRIEDTAGDKAAALRLAQDIRAEKQRIVAAVEANTPPAPPG